MNRIFFRTIFFFILSIVGQQAMAQGFSFAQAFPSNNYINILRIKTDASNNSYSIGRFRGTVDVDAGSNTYSFTAGGINDMFLLKEDAAGNFIWAKHFKGLSSASYGIMGQTIDFDASGSIYIAGAIRDSFDLDPSSGVYNFSTGGADVAFILKLDSLGNFIWIRTHQVSAINGNVSEIASMKIIGETLYIVSSFAGTVDIDPSLGVTNVTSSPTLGTDMLLIKMDTAGNFLWGKKIGGTGSDYISSLTTDSTDNLYITGIFQNTVDFNPSTAVDTFTSAGDYDIFVAKYDSVGSYLWAKRIGGGGLDEATCIALDKVGNITVTGSFNGTVDFDPDAGIYNLTSNSTHSIFILKLRNNGNFAWTRKAGYSSGTYRGLAIATDTTANIYVASANYPLQKFDSSGNIIWTLNTVGEHYWMNLDNNNAIYLSGSFSGTQDFDPGPGVFNLTGANNSGFILKLCDSIPPIPLTVSSTTACIGDTVTINAPSFVPLPVIWTQYGVSNPLPDTGLSIKVTTTGLYQIKVANSLCPWVGSVYVHVYPPSNPSISLPPPSGAVLAGQQVSINATVSNFVTAFKIDWYKNGSLLSTTPPQATLLQYTKTAGTDTIKAVVYEWSNPCSVPDTSNVVLVQEALGVADVQKQSLTLYPIPCQDWLYISGVARGDRLLLCDLSGKTVLAATAEGQQQQINTSALAAGCYMLRVMAINKQTKGALPVVKR